MSLHEPDFNNMEFYFKWRRRSKEGLITRIYGNQRLRSRQRNDPYPDYKLAELREWFYSQQNFDKLYLDWVCSGWIKNLVPSADRLDDYKPYTLDNLRLVTWVENNARSHRDRRNGINNKMSKVVLQFDLNGNFIKEYYSVSHASRETKTSLGNVSSVCTGRRELAGGFIWSHK